MTATTYRRVVVDTNVLVSAVLFRRSIPAQAFARILYTAEFLISKPLLDELSQVLRRTKFDPIVTIEERMLFLSRIAEYLVGGHPAHIATGCRDPKDDMVLELALFGQADLIVSGDTDLLVLNPWRGIPILEPAEYLLQTGSLAPHPHTLYP